MWGIRNYVLVLLATAGGVLAQSSPQQLEPKKPLLDLTFPPRGWPSRPTPKNKLVMPLLNPRPASPPMFRADHKRYLLKAAQQPSTCSIPLLEAPIPKDTHFTIRMFRPARDKMAPMPLVRPLAPSCAETR